MTQARFYANSPPSTLSVALSEVTPGTAGVIEVDDITDWPGQHPYTVLIDWGQDAFEIATITQAPTGTGPYTFSGCTRGDDGTLAPAHGQGAVIVPGVSARDFTQFAGALLASDNLADLASAPAARSALGLGSAATQSSGAFDTAGAASTAQAAAQAFASGLQPTTGAPLPLLRGGTGISAAGIGALLTALGLGSAATQAASSFDAAGAAAAVAAAALAKSGGTLTGRLIPAVFALADAATITVDASLGNIATVTLGGDRDIAAPSNPVNGQPLEFWLSQDSTGGRGVTWDPAYSFGGGIAPDLSSAAAALDRVGFRYSAAKTAWLYNGSLTGF